MAEKYDVAARLAEGRPAVDNIQSYVWACHVLGYANPDLTVNATQVCDWYDTEDGLDLRALDTDRAALESVVAATQDAVARQNEQLVALAAAWQGSGADGSRDFLRRHGEASTAAAAAVRTSAEALATLRDNLWHSVDGKAAAAIAADGRALDDWLDAAHTVTMGAGDRAAASEQVDRDVKPFVDNDIRTEWLTAMRSATAAVTELYDAATAELTAEPDAVFDVPSGLGPSWTAPSGVEAATVPAAASISAPPVAAPASWGAPPSWGPPPAAAPMPVAQPPAPTPAPPAVDAGSTAPAMAAPPSMPSLSGMPAIGSGLSGLGQQLADAFGSLLGSADDGVSDPPDSGDPQVGDNVGDDHVDNGVKDASKDSEATSDPPADPKEGAATDVPTDAELADGACKPADAAAEPMPPEPPTQEPAPTPVPSPPPEPAAPPEPVAGETPCEIAAAEVPQVGQ